MDRSPYWQCQRCAADIDELTRVEYITFGWRHKLEGIERLCRACAAALATETTFGDPDEFQMGGAAERLMRECDRPLVLQWVNGDTFRFMLLARLATDEEIADPDKVRPLGEGPPGHFTLVYVQPGKAPPSGSTD